MNVIKQIQQNNYFKYDLQLIKRSIIANRDINGLKELSKIQIPLYQNVVKSICKIPYFKKNINQADFNVKDLSQQTTCNDEHLIDLISQVPYDECLSFIKIKEHKRTQLLKDQMTKIFKQYHSQIVNQATEQFQKLIPEDDFKKIMALIKNYWRLDKDNCQELVESYGLEIMSTNFDKLVKLYNLEEEKEINGKKQLCLKPLNQRQLNQDSYSFKLLNQNKIKQFMFGKYESCNNLNSIFYQFQYNFSEGNYDLTNKQPEYFYYVYNHQYINQLIQKGKVDINLVLQFYQMRDDRKIQEHINQIQRYERNPPSLLNNINVLVCVFILAEKDSKYEDMLKQVNQNIYNLYLLLKQYQNGKDICKQIVKQFRAESDQLMRQRYLSTLSTLAQRKEYQNLILDIIQISSELYQGTQQASEKDLIARELNVLQIFAQSKNQYTQEIIEKFVDQLLKMQQNTKYLQVYNQWMKNTISNDFLNKLLTYAQDQNITTQILTLLITSLCKQQNQTNIDYNYINQNVRDLDELIYQLDRYQHKLYNIEGLNKYVCEQLVKQMNHQKLLVQCLTKLQCQTEKENNLLKELLKNKFTLTQDCPNINKLYYNDNYEIIKQLFIISSINPEANLFYNNIQITFVTTFQIQNFLELLNKFVEYQKLNEVQIMQNKIDQGIQKVTQYLTNYLKTVIEKPTKKQIENIMQLMNIIINNYVQLEKYQQIQELQDIKQVLQQLFKKLGKGCGKHAVVVQRVQEFVHTIIQFQDIINIETNNQLINLLFQSETFSPLALFLIQRRNTFSQDELVKVYGKNLGMSASNLLMKIKIQNIGKEPQYLVKLIGSIFNKEAILFVTKFIYNNFSFDQFVESLKLIEQQIVQEERKNEESDNGVKLDLKVINLEFLIEEADKLSEQQLKQLSQIQQKYLIQPIITFIYVEKNIKLDITIDQLLEQYDENNSYLSQKVIEYIINNYDKQLVIQKLAFYGSNLGKLNSIIHEIIKYLQAPSENKETKLLKTQIYQQILQISFDNQCTVRTILYPKQLDEDYIEQIVRQLIWTGSINKEYFIALENLQNKSQFLNNLVDYINDKQDLKNIDQNDMMLIKFAARNIK